MLRDQLQEERDRVREQLARLGTAPPTTRRRQQLDFDENFADSGPGHRRAGRGRGARRVSSARRSSDIEDALAKFDAGTYGDVRVVRAADPRGPARGDARGTALHQLRVAAPLARTDRRSVNLDEQTLIYFGCLVVAVILHEISHGVVALWFGDHTAKEAGRLTLNPVPHIDPFGSIILPAMGAITGLPVLAWAKPVPVNPNRMRQPAPRHALRQPRRARHQLRADARGRARPPARVYQSRLRRSTLYEQLPLGTQILFSFAVVNLFLGLFNLLPIPPLDGSALIERCCRRVAAALVQVPALRVPGLFLLVFSTGVISEFLDPFVDQLFDFVFG